MPIVYDKLRAMLKERGISIYRLKTDKVIGAATLDKIRKSEGHIDTRSIESICRYLHCQPGDIMAYTEKERSEEEIQMPMSELAQDTARMLDMLPEDEQMLAYELVKRIVRAWDPDFTKLTPAEVRVLQQAIEEEENGDTIPYDAIDWNA